MRPSYKREKESQEKKEIFLSVKNPRRNKFGIWWVKKIKNRSPRRKKVMEASPFGIR